MYDTTFRCTYNLIEDEEESELLYKLQYLQAFKLEDWDGDKINECIEYITTKFKDNEKGRSILKCMRDKLSIAEGNYMEVLFLCTYDFFYLVHDCLIDLINTDDINTELYNKTIQKIAI